MYDYTFHWRPAFQAIPAMLDGAIITVQVAVLSIVMGVFFAIILAVASSSNYRSVKFAAATWVEGARNTPALFQIYMAYFGLGSLGIYLDSYLALLLGITFNNAGYLAETFRGGLRAIPEIQTRAGRSLGLSEFDTFRLIVLPQLFRTVFYPMTNQFVWAILMTSLGVTVGLNTDLTGVTQELNVRTFRTFEYFALAACIYFLITKLVNGSARLAAWRLFRY